MASETSVFTCNVSFRTLLILETLWPCRSKQLEEIFGKRRRNPLFFIFLLVTINQQRSSWSVANLAWISGVLFVLFLERIMKKAKNKKEKRKEGGWRQMTRMAVSCRARLYCYFRSKQQGSSWSSGRSTWWITLAPTQPIFFFLQWKRRTERWWGRTADQSNVRSKALFFPQC